MLMLLPACEENEINWCCSELASHIVLRVCALMCCSSAKASAELALTVAICHSKTMDSRGVKGNPASN